ncbi:MAG: hypothetical protein ACSHXY_09560 [Alphaproteobacteria bacterium]
MEKPAILIAGLIFSAMAFGAQAQVGDGPLRVKPVTGEALTQAFSGVTMDGIYKLPRERSGTQQFTETFNADGTTDYREGKIIDKGQWAANDDTICFRYSGPMAGGYSCFNVFKAGTCYYSYARVNVKDGKPVDENRWSAKTITRGDISTCDNLVS